MDIKDVLKNNFGVRVTNCDKWLIWSIVSKGYVVYEQEKYQRSSKILIETDDFSEALDKLIEEDK